MKNLVLKTAFTLLLLSFFMVSCSKEGFDGNSSISGTAAHHELPIAGTIVYIKFGASELPGTMASDFDASATANSQGVYQFENLKKGTYYLFGVGYDSTISQVVKGGIQVTLGKDEDKTVPLAVTED